MISKKDIEKRRTPSELRGFVQRTRNQVEANADELIRARRKTGLYKTFVDEIIPLSICADHLCSHEETILPVLGNQGYDAIIFDALGKQKERIEITKPFDGKGEADDVTLLEKRRYGKIRIRDLGEGLTELLPYIHKTAKAKSIKDYSDCTVLIVVSIDPPFDEELTTLAASAQELCTQLQELDFRARRVILAVPPLKEVYVVQEEKH